MKQLSVLLIVLSMIISVHNANAAKPKAGVITFDGYKQIKIGMKIKEVSKQTGYKFINAAGFVEGDCAYVTSKSQPGLSFMLISGIIARIDIAKGNFSTEAGAKTGDTEMTIKSKYPGRVKVERHEYDLKGHYIKVISANKKRSVVFETDGKKVTRWRVGRIPEVNYVEGCE